MGKKEWTNVVLIAFFSWVLVISLLFLFVIAALSSPVYSGYSHSNYNDMIICAISAFVVVVIYFVLLYFILKNYPWLQKIKIWLYGLLLGIAFWAFTYVTICGL